MAPRVRRIAVTATILTALSACAPAGQPQAQATVQASISPLLVEHPSPTPSPTPAPTPTPAPAATAAPTLPPNVFTIAMPVYWQVMNLDCETAALQMGLAALGHTYSQQQLFAYEKPDTRQPVMKPGTKVVLQWGNPYTNFVGDVNGIDTVPTGYGVYWPIILEVARSHGAPGSVGREGYSAGEIYAALQAHHPVLVWVETGWMNPGSLRGTWTAWDGNTRINYSLIEHVVTLSGVSPTQVRVNDPWKAGSQYWYSKAAFEYSWRDFNDMAVILQ
jgi:uncharacterized protein YvpB